MTEPMFDLPEEQPAQRPRRSQAQDEQLFVDQIMYLLAGSPLGYPGYEDTLPRKNDITLQRLIHSKEIFVEEMCTEFEAMLYLSTASLSAPMDHDWVAIYMWLFNRWKPEAAEEMEIGVEVLDRNQVDHLNRFRRWMFRTQMNHMKAKNKAADQKEVAEEKQRLEIERPSMWESPDEETE